MTKKGNMTALDIGLVDYIIQEMYMTYCSKTKDDSNLCIIAYLSFIQH